MTARVSAPTHQRDQAKRQPCRRLEVLAMLKASPMSRHALGEKLGVGYDTVAAHVAAQQANGLVTPDGHERTPGRRTWRMIFRATGAAT